MAAFRHTLRVRFQECDPQGVVYFARYPEDRARVAEISREVTRDLGFNWLAAFNDGTWQLGLRTGAGVVGSVIGALRGSATSTGGLVGASFTSGNFDINSIIDELLRVVQQMAMIVVGSTITGGLLGATVGAFAGGAV